MKVSDFVVERLHEWGVRRIYGYPGDGIIGVIGALQRADKIEFIQVRHEEMAHARILKTTDGGKTWRAVFDSDRPGDNNWKLAFPSATVGYGTIISDQAPDGEARGYVVKTVDGGEHWRRMTVTDDVQWVPYGINFLDEMHGWVGGSTGGFETRDGGESWQRVNMGLSANKIRFVKRTDGRVAVFAIGQSLYRLDGPSSP